MGPDAPPRPGAVRAFSASPLLSHTREATVQELTVQKPVNAGGRAASSRRRGAGRAFPIGRAKARRIPPAPGKNARATQRPFMRRQQKNQIALFLYIFLLRFFQIML